MLDLSFHKKVSHGRKSVLEKALSWTLSKMYTYYLKRLLLRILDGSHYRDLRRKQPKNRGVTHTCSDWFRRFLLGKCLIHVGNNVVSSGEKKNIAKRLSRTFLDGMSEFQEFANELHKHWGEPSTFRVLKLSKVPVHLRSSFY